MKKNLTLLAIIVCCAFACSSTNCFAQIQFVSRGLKACSKGLLMGGARATVQINDLRANLDRRMAVATRTPQHNSWLSRGKGIESYKPSIKIERIKPMEKIELSIIPMTAFELPLINYIKGDSLPHTKDFEMRQSATEAEEWTAPKGQVASPQNPDNR